MGSVKDLVVEKPATAGGTGIGVFHFTDDYSVFDYGKMPDTIPQKGEALCRMSAFNFKELEKLGIRSHFRGLAAGNKMNVDLVRVLFPQKNEIQENDSNYLIPLEVVFRNSIPKGSRFYKRIEDGVSRLEDFGLKEMPKFGETLPQPLIDISTKLEPSDRFLSEAEAIQMARMSESEFNEMKNAALKIDDFLTQKAESLGLEHADGKVEFAFNENREVILVDVVGTLDENRFLYNGTHLSKQVLRDYYKTLPWAEEVNKCKAEGKGPKEWPVPPNLPKELIEIVSNMYKSVCEAWAGEKVWNAPKVSEVVDSYLKFLDEKG